MLQYYSNEVVPYVNVPWEDHRHLGKSARTQRVMLAYRAYLPAKEFVCIMLTSELSRSCTLRELHYCAPLRLCGLIGFYTKRSTMTSSAYCFFCFFGGRGDYATD